ncbi:UvrD-like helicase C-terminal domain-containing protein [Clostridium grantii DSM 8605]|uniref:DNA 3'-5' helicase n=1 Tax=Clostridium grantii DSM 8605 TaxID=1121316 RepID=A0A1M5Y1U5_9CLOT|nr:UvrD-like helicase C-terminal domain-containing protein [Clostridium grantii DSM 8605]
MNNFISNKSIVSNELNFGEDSFEFNHMLEYLLNGLEKRLSKVKFETSGIEINDLVRKLKNLKNQDISKNKLDLSYILIDEFQDTDSIQVEFLLWLINYSGCYATVVGDIKQSIYRFRGAEYTAFNEYTNKLIQQVDKNEIKNCILDKNYRSEENLLNSINDFFVNVGDKKADTNDQLKYFQFKESDKLKSIIKGKSGQGLKRFYVDNSESKFQGKIDYIIDLIEEINSNKIKDNSNNAEKESITVLVRSNENVDRVVKELERNSILCKTEKKGGFYRSIAIKEFYVLLKALLYPNVSLYQYALSNSSYGEGISNDIILDDFSVNRDYLKRIVEDTEVFEILRTYIEDLKHYPTLEVLEKVVKQLEPYKKYGINFMKDRKNQIDDDEELLKKVKTIMINIFINDKDGKILLGYCISLDENQFSNTHYENKITEEEKEIIAEETRLLYVAITRGKKSVHMYNSKLSYDNGRINTWSNLIARGNGNV